MESTGNPTPYCKQVDELPLKEVINKLKGWWKFLLSKIYVILIVGAIGGSIGAVIAFFGKSVYKAQLTFVLEGGPQSRSSMGNYAGIASQFGIDMGGGGQGVFEGENFLALMKSRLMIEKALLKKVNVDNKSQTLIDFYLDFSGLRAKWVKKGSPLKDIKFLEHPDPSKFSILQNTVITTVHGMITGKNMIVDKLDKKSAIISLTVISESELFSKFFVETLSDVVSKFYVETKTKKATDNVRILQIQTDSIKNELNRALVGAAVSRDANPNANLARQVLTVPSQRRQGDVQTNQAILAQLIQNLEISKMSLRTETPLIQVIDRPVLPLEETAPDPLFSFIKWDIVFSFFIVLYLIISRFLNSL